MTSLVDFQIRELSRTAGLIEPYEPEQQNPASYDVRLGSTIVIETPSSINYHQPNEADRWQEIDLSTKPYYLGPGGFILACTEEYIRVPNDLEAVFCLKSSRGREGWEHALAGFIDPAFHGRVTLELKNFNKHQYLKVEAGMLIGQLRFSRLDAVPIRPYSVTGRYHGDSYVQISKG